MSFSQEVKAELKNKNFTVKRRNSKIFLDCPTENKKVLRERFLQNGSICDPEKSYLLEFFFNEESTASDTTAIISSFGISSRTVLRKDSYVIYIQDADAISDVLNILGAHKSLLKFENMRIYKEMRENVQRRVNCETSNLKKTVTASLRQIEDIEYIEANLGFEKLPQSLKEIAELRLAMPNATLNELSKALDPPIGKSGINHRLRKLSKTAEELRNLKLEENMHYDQ